MQHIVAPFAGAWIEINHTPEKERYIQVAPFAGAWIEINCIQHREGSGISRSLCGSVD